MSNPIQDTISHLVTWPTLEELSRSIPFRPHDTAYPAPTHTIIIDPQTISDGWHAIVTGGNIRIQVSWGPPDDLSGKQKTEEYSGQVDGKDVRVYGEMWC